MVAYDRTLLGTVTRAQSLTCGTVFLAKMSTIETSFTMMGAMHYAFRVIRESLTNGAVTFAWAPTAREGPATG